MVLPADADELYIGFFAIGAYSTVVLHKLVPALPLPVMVVVGGVLAGLVGGLLADNYLGSKKAVKFGAILMALGSLIVIFDKRFKRKGNEA